MFFTGISWVAIIVAAVAVFITGWLWYSPWLFAKAWMKELGYNPDDMKNADTSGMWKKFLVVFIGEIIMATVAAAIMNSLFIVSWGQIFVTAFSIWIGFVVVNQLNEVLFGGRTKKYFLITTGQSLLAILVVFIIISLWK